MSAVEPDNDEILDEEIVEIFIEEAGEVLEDIANYFPQWAANPDDTQGALKDLRRSFHTLKGSGRMVKAVVIGELAWSIENMLNKVLDGKLPVTPDIVSTVEAAWQRVPALVEAFQQQQTVAIEGTDLGALIERANALSKGQQPATAATPPSAEPTEQPAMSEAEMKEIHSRIDALQGQLTSVLDAVQNLQQQLDSVQQQQAGALQQGSLDSLEQRIETNYKDIQDLKYFVKSNGDKSVSDGRDLKNDLTNRVKEARLVLDNAQQELRSEMQQIKQDSAGIKSTIVGWAVGSAVVCTGLLALGLFLMSQA